MKMIVSKTSTFKRRFGDERKGKIGAIDGKRLREDLSGNRLDNGSTHESIPYNSPMDLDQR